MAEPEIRELRYFRAVAEDLNITRAAERLGIAQPPLSRAMRQLERRLGVDLFDRTDQRIALTEAGETFLKESALVLDALDSAVLRTRRAAHPASLVVTAKPGVATDLLQRVVADFRAEAEAPEIRVVVSGFGEQVEFVRSGRADVAILGSPYRAGGLASEHLVSEPRMAALPVGHELAGREVLSTADLLDWPAPRWSGAGDSDRDYWLGHPDRVTAGPVVEDTSQLLEVVALGQAVALLPTSLARRNQRPDVVFVPVPDASPYELMVVWRPDNRSPWIVRFVAGAKRWRGRPGEL
ncbi:LysR family transcriptional regulator [Kribbella sancticallisti]|uniref:LysR family transcriptional regulator n=1 Tax=Kribbella sancticallisti TaxID=460087 RepID=A0ABN2EFF5_9ACTN